jgi:hypothetical protein
MVPGRARTAEVTFDVTQYWRYQIMYWSTHFRRTVAPQQPPFGTRSNVRKPIKADAKHHTFANIPILSVLEVYLYSRAQTIAYRLHYLLSVSLPDPVGWNWNELPKHFCGWRHSRLEVNQRLRETRLLRILQSSISPYQYIRRTHWYTHRIRSILVVTAAARKR